MSRASKKLMGASFASGGVVIDPAAYAYVDIRTGTGSIKNITMNFQPDLFLTKKRSATTLTGARWVDSIRGATKHIDSSSTSAQVRTADTLTSFNADGVSLGSDATTSAFNTLNHTYVDYGFKKLIGFFDVKEHVGDGASVKVVAHDLETQPDMVISKPTSTTGNWYVYIRQFGPNSNTQYKLLNSNALPVSASTVWGNTSPTSSNLYVGSLLNTSGVSYVNYLFASKNGVCKVGKYEGSLSSTKTVDIGFQPRMVMVTRTDAVGDWYIFDTSRGINSAANDPRLSLNTTAAEVSTDNSIEPYSNGFIVNQNAITNLNVPEDGNNTVAASSGFGTSAIYDGIYAEGVHIIVGIGGKVGVSVDGEVFTLVDAGFGTSDVRGIAHNGVDRFVIVGAGGKVAYSTNKGATWTLGNSGVTSTLFDVVYGNGKFILIGTGSRTSVDGATWTASTYPEAMGYLISYVGGYFIAGGYSNGKYNTSLDGTTWVTRTVTGSTSTTYRFEYKDGLFILSDRSKIYTTSDFVTHTTRFDGTAGAVWGFANAPDGSVYAGGAGVAAATFLRSVDGGISWNVITSPTGFGTITTMYSNGQKLWIAGSSGLIRYVTCGIYHYLAIA